MKKIIYYCLISLTITVTVSAQEIKKDTLFFKFDKNYILNSKAGTGNFILKDRNKDGEFFFQRVKTYTDLKPKKIIDLKKFIRHSFFYNCKRKHSKLDYYGLSGYLNNYVVFLVKKEDKKKKYIEVYVVTAETE